MKNTFANFFSVNDIVCFSINCESSKIVKLSSWCWIESALIKDDNIFLILILNVQENINNLSIKFIKFVILEIQTISFGQMICIIKNYLSSLCNSFLLFSNLLVQIIRNRQTRNLRNWISWNTPWLHRCDPIFDW